MNAVELVFSVAALVFIVVFIWRHGWIDEEA